MKPGGDRLSRATGETRLPFWLARRRVGTATLRRDPKQGPPALTGERGRPVRQPRETLRRWLNKLVQRASRLVDLGQPRLTRSSHASKLSERFTKRNRSPIQ